MRAARPALSAAVLICLAVVWLDIAVAAPAQADSAASLRVLTDCLATAAPKPAANAAPAGSRADADLSADCPALLPAISELGLNAQLGERWRGHVTRSALEQLLQLEGRYQARAPSTAPNVAALPQILERLQPAPTRRSWWQAFKDWVRQLWAPSSAAGGGWLEQLLSHVSIPRLAQRLILYLGIAAVIAMALWTIVAELRAAGLLSGGSGERRSVGLGAPSAPPSPGPQSLSWSDIEGAPLALRPGLLMQLLIQALLRAGRLRNEQALTYRELGEHSAFARGEQRVRFARLASLAEQERFGGRAPSADQWAAACNEGQALYAEISGGSDRTARAP